MEIRIYIQLGLKNRKVILDSNSIHELLHFVYRSHGTYTNRLDEARYKFLDLEKLPPTRNAFLQHCNQVIIFNVGKSTNYLQQYFQKDPRV